MNKQEKELHNQLLEILFEMIRDEGEYTSADELEELILRWVSEQGVKICSLGNFSATGNQKQKSKATKQGEMSNEKIGIKQKSFSDSGLDALAKSLQKVNQATEASKPLSMQALKSNEKLPQERIERNLNVEKNFGIKELKCTVRRGKHYDGHWHTEELEVRGELSGRLPKDIILFVMVYNGNEEMMAYGEISIYHGNVSESFSESISIPKDETISKIVVRPIYRPTEFATGAWASLFAHD